MGQGAPAGPQEGAGTEAAGGQENQDFGQTQPREGGRYFSRGQSVSQWAGSLLLFTAILRIDMICCSKVHAGLCVCASVCV